MENCRVNKESVGFVAVKMKDQRIAKWHVNIVKKGALFLVCLQILVLLALLLMLTVEMRGIMDCDKRRELLLVIGRLLFLPGFSSHSKARQNRHFTVETVLELA